MPSDPQHPGAVLQNDFLKPLGLLPREVANAMIDANSDHVLKIVRGQSGVSPAMGHCGLRDTSAPHRTIGPRFKRVSILPALKKSWGATCARLCR